jgi:hypothetical protein
MYVDVYYFGVHMYVDVYYLTRSWIEIHVPWVLGCACCCITCDVYCIVVGSWIPVSGSVSTGSNAFDWWSLLCHNYKTGNDKASQNLCKLPEIWIGQGSI